MNFQKNVIKYIYRMIFFDKLNVCILTKVGISSFFFFLKVFKTLIDILYIKFITHNIFQNHSKYTK
jgi:hypothetical protein